MKIAGAILGAVLGLLALTWAIQGNDFFLYRTFAPKYEAVRRQTFEQSKAYNQGVAQEIARAYQDYERASTPGQKDAIAAVVRHQMADYDEAQLPAHLRAFVRSVR